MTTNRVAAYFGGAEARTRVRLAESLWREGELAKALARRDLRWSVALALGVVAALVLGRLS